MLVELRPSRFLPWLQPVIKLYVLNDPASLGSDELGIIDFPSRIPEVVSTAFAR